MKLWQIEPLEQSFLKWGLQSLRRLPGGTRGAQKIVGKMRKMQKKNMNVYIFYIYNNHLPSWIVQHSSNSQGHDLCRPGDLCR